MIHPDMTEAEVPTRILELERRCSELERQRDELLHEGEAGTSYKCSTFVRGEPGAVRNPWTGEYAEPDE